MSTNQINLAIDLKGQYCNHWPFARIIINDQILFDSEVVDSVNLIFNIDAQKKNRLSIEHHSKQFGDNNVYDCTSDQSQDCILTIKDIRFEDITVGSEIMNQLFLKPVWTEKQLQTMSPDVLLQMSTISCQDNTMMNFNSIFNLEFETPILNWLTISKYKKPLENNAYFSNYSSRWHYEKDIELLEEIKELMSQ
jgi:hypothetical protein